MPRQDRWSMFVFASFYLISFMSQAVSGLTCVQCVSVNTPSCLHGDLSPTPCRGPEVDAKYCQKSVGTQVSGHGRFVSRGCSNSLQTNCTSTLLQGDLYTVCHDSCTQDGCNGAWTLLSEAVNHTTLTLMVITGLLVARVSSLQHL